ncbi:MAG: DUF3472 domain-containing protein [Kiritimatiellia bacterium]
MKVSMVAALAAGFAALGGFARTGEEQARTQARSVHLTYRDWPKPATVLYSEATVEEEYPGSYFCLSAFNGGYGGVQTLPDGSHWLIFSVWDKGNAETDARKVRRVQHEYAGEGVETARFGGEGTGGRAMAKWPWALGKTVRFAVSTAAVEDDKTAYTGWIWDDRHDAWFRIATFVSAVNRTPGKLTGCYSFVEDFLRNGESRLHARRARFGMVWGYGEQGWGAAAAASFSGDGNTLDTIDCTALTGAIELTTGGTTVQKTALNAVVRPSAPPADGASARYRAKLLEAIAAAARDTPRDLDFGVRLFCPPPVGARRGEWLQLPARELGDGLHLAEKVYDAGAYRRRVFELSAGQPVMIGRINFFTGVADAAVSGNTDGAVGYTEANWFGIEHPMAKVRKRPIAEAKWSEADYRALSQRIALPKLAGGERLRVTFNWTALSRRLDIAGVALEDGQGRTVAEDRHDGFAGLSRERNVYTLTVPEELHAGTLVATYKYVDGYRSEGEIRVETDRPTAVDGWIERGFRIEPGRPWTFSVVEGKYAPGQLRRDFQAYIEAERAHPYRIFAHYNSWFHLGIHTYQNEDPLRRMTEEKCLAAICDVCDPLRRRGVTLDSYLWDDGWDEWNSLWEYHRGFPRGFAPLVKAAAARGGGIGAWLSPWGGYNRAAAMRKAYAKQIGLPTNAQGMSLAEPKYYAAFRDRCLQMIRDYGMNMFKFDGIGGGSWATGVNAKTAPDLQGLFTLIGELRQAKGDVFINCTVGTWPSPFWVLHADSIWRGGSDWGAVKGEGHLRERWITYRDDVIYRRFAKPCPLFPLNSLMMHGIIVTDVYGMPVSDKDEDVRAFANEVWMGVGCGTGLQEYYINPELMSEKWWDILSGAIGWVRANAAVLRDVHWVGGEPGAGEVYGYASWSPRKSIVVLRNPSAVAQTWPIDWRRLLELPEGADVPRQIGCRYAASGRSIAGLFNARGEIALDPFETVVIELQ